MAMETRENYPSSEFATFSTGPALPGAACVDNETKEFALQSFVSISPAFAVAANQRDSGTGGE